MPNSDNAHGVFNKETVIYSRSAENDTTTFSNVDEAKAYLLSAAALTVIDECATQVQWELVGNTGFKVTYAFGTKGAGTAEADDWTAQFHSRKKAVFFSLMNIHTRGMSSKFVRSSKVHLCRIQKDTRCTVK